MAHTVKALKVLIAAELSKGAIFEGRIVGSQDYFVEGVCRSNGEITVNPAPNVADTLIHELLHRRFPAWSEDRVRMETKRVMRQMSDADVAALYKRYKRLAKPKRTPVRLRIQD